MCTGLLAQEEDAREAWCAKLPSATLQGKKKLLSATLQGKNGRFYQDSDDGHKSHVTRQSFKSNVYWNRENLFYSS